MPVKTVHPGEMGVYVFTSSAKKEKRSGGVGAEGEERSGED